MAAQRPNVPLKFPNEFNVVLLCMGLFSHFLSVGRAA